MDFDPRTNNTYSYGSSSVNLHKFNVFPMKCSIKKKCDFSFSFLWSYETFFQLKLFIFTVLHRSLVGALGL